MYVCMYVCMYGQFKSRSLAGDQGRRVRMAAATHLSSAFNTLKVEMACTGNTHIFIHLHTYDGHSLSYSQLQTCTHTC
jgi:hypothetical protein